LGGRVDAERRQEQREILPLGPDDFRSTVMRQLLLSSYPVSPFDALKRLINSNREFQQRAVRTI
jgi:hypothetical protein